MEVTISIKTKDGELFELSLEQAKEIRDTLIEILGVEKKETYWDKLYDPSPRYPKYNPVWDDVKTGNKYPKYPEYPTITCSTFKNYLDMQ